MRQHREYAVVQKCCYLWRIQRLKATFLQLILTMNFLHIKASVLTLLLLLASVSVTNTGCGVKLPTDVQSSIGTLSKALPLLMGKATGAFTPELGKEADGLLAMITTASKMTSGGKTDKVSGLISSLGSSKVLPFINLWKQKGKLDQSTVTTAISGVNSALSAIKKAGRIK